MKTNFETMGNWEIDKACFLIKQARELGMDLTGYGELSVNQNSGYTYLWLEDYSFTLYMPISCDLERSDVWVMWTNPYNGEEIEESLDQFDSLAEIAHWCSEQEEKAEKEL